jgi:DNA-binding CsgD family transcriptional regulator
MNEELLNEELLNEVKRTNRLLVVMATKDLSQTDKIDTLYKAGYSPKEIAQMVGTTGNTVNVTINKLKKASAKKNK